MAYMSKLTKRLSLVGRTLALLSFVAACAGTDAATAPATTPTPPEVSAVSVMPESLGANIGMRIRLSAEVRDIRGQALRNETVSWTTSDATIASVDTSGSVMLLSSGTVEIRATARGKTGRGKVTVTPTPVAVVQVTPSSVSVAVGATTQLTATTRSATDSVLTGRVVTWASNNTSVATVDATGLVTGRSAGTAQVSATSEGIMGSASVAVTAPPPPPASVLQAVILSPASASVAAGATKQFSVSGQWSDGATTAPSVTYSATGGTISAAGLYTAGATAGAFRVIAVQQGGTLADTSAVTVTVAAPVLQAVILTPASVSLAAGATQQFSVSGQWSNGATTAPSVTYSATGGTISAAGLYTAGATAGTFRVIAIQQGGTLADTSAVTVTVAAPVLQAVILTPATASLAAGTTKQFSVSGQWSNGATTAPSVTYSATGGTVSAAGLYTAGATAGTFRVIAVQQGGTLADTSAVTVTVAAPVLQAVILSPASVSLAAGATQQFSVSGQWSNGATTAPLVTFSATGGTVSAAGLYTAGATAGTFRVIAVQQGGTLADTSAVTVTVPTAGLANECSAPKAGWVWCDDFDVDRLGSYFEYDSQGGGFARVSGVGNSGSTGMRARWTAGQSNAGSLHLALGKTPQSYFRPVDAGTANYRELYWRVYVRNQAGWTGGGGDKLSRAFSFASSTSWAQAMIAHVWSGANTTDRDFLTLDPARGTDAAGNLVTTDYNDFANLTWLGLTKGSNAIFSAAKVGTWHCIEARARLNDAGVSNGVTELWVDGVLDASKTGLNFLGSFSAYGLNAVYLENFWNAGSPVAQERYMDNFVVSTQRIGC